MVKHGNTYEQYTWLSVQSLVARRDSVQSTVSAYVYSQVRLVATFKRNCPLSARELSTYITALLWSQNSVRIYILLLSEKNLCRNDYFTVCSWLCFTSSKRVLRKGKEFLKSTAKFARLESAFL